MGNEVIIDNKVITIKNKCFRDFNSELRGLLGTNPYKYFNHFTFIFHTELNENDNIGIGDYYGKTTVKINNCNQIEYIYHQSKSMYHSMRTVEKKYFYDNEGCIMEHSIETHTGYFVRFDFNSDKDGNYLQIFQNDELVVDNIDKSLDELKQYTKKINYLIYISDLDILFLEKQSCNEKD